MSGSVWYVPALADLRAGADRPRSRRDAAGACVSAWGTAGVSAVLFLVTEVWWIPALAVASGTTVALALRIRAAVRRRRETEEAVRDWARLRLGSPAGARPRDGRTAFAALLVTGLATAAATAALLLTTASAGAVHWPTAAVPVTLVALFLLIGVTVAHAYARSGPRSRDVHGRTG
ncbi:hypothetical protein ACWEBX_08825 [Streptomyces sp. NPDC005070]